MVTINTATVPLALRSEGYGTTAGAAKGFGLAGAGQIAKLERSALALVDNLLESNLLTLRAPTDTDAVVGKNGQPVLVPPDAARIERAVNGARNPEAPLLSGAGALATLLGMLSKALGTQSLAAMQANASQRDAQLQARATQGLRLSQAQEQARLAEQAAAEAAEGTAAEAEMAQAAAEAARADAERLQQALDGMDPADPGYADAESALAKARQGQAQAQQHSEGAAARALAAGATYQRAADAYSAAIKDGASFNREDPTGIRPPGLDELSSRSARMQALIGQLSEIMSDASMDKLRSDAAAALKQMEASQKEQLRLAEEQEKELERMREAEKKSGCFGKVFGWVGKALAAVGSALAIVAGVLTANPALVVAGVVGMALTIDSIQAEFTGYSVMGKATEALGGVIAKGMVKLGVDETLAQQIGNIVATIVIVVVIIAASIAAGNVGAVADSISKVAIALKQIVQIVQTLAQLASLGATVAVGVGNVIVAGIQVDIAELLALLETLGFNDEVLREMLAMAQDAAAQLSRTGAELMLKSSDILAEEAQTAKAVLQSIATTAARA